MEERCLAQAPDARSTIAVQVRAYIDINDAEAGIIVPRQPGRVSSVARQSLT